MQNMRDKTNNPIGGWLLIIISICIGIIAFQAYRDRIKRIELAVLLSRIGNFKADYTEKLLTEGMKSNSDTLSFQAFDLKNYGLSQNDLLTSKGTVEGTFNYIRKVELTPNQIILTFGKGFDGDSEKTFVVDVANVSEEGVKWRCTGGTLSNKYRLSNCRK